LEGAAGVFGGEAKPDAALLDIKTMHAKIGALALENDFFGARVLIPMADLLLFCRNDHPARLVRCSSNQAKNSPLEQKEIRPQVYLRGVSLSYLT
jgi:hypothetical protein